MYILPLPLVEVAVRVPERAPALGPVIVISPLLSHR